MTQDVNDWNNKIIAEFRANKGIVGGPFAGMTVLLLHHKGAKSGSERVNPLVYAIDGDRMVIFASKGGAATNPDWYHNLKANPDARIEVGTDEIDVTAEEITGEERDRIYAKQSEDAPQFGGYQKNTKRKIPVVALNKR